MARPTSLPVGRVDDADPLRVHRPRAARRSPGSESPNLTGITCRRTWLRRCARTVCVAGSARGTRPAWRASHTAICGCSSRAIGARRSLLPRRSRRRCGSRTSSGFACLRRLSITRGGLRLAAHPWRVSRAADPWRAPRIAYEGHAWPEARAGRRCQARWGAGGAAASGGADRADGVATSRCRVGVALKGASGPREGLCPPSLSSTA